MALESEPSRVLSYILDARFCTFNTINDIATLIANINFGLVGLFCSSTYYFTRFVQNWAVATRFRVPTGICFFAFCCEFHEIRTGQEIPEVFERLLATVNL